MLICERADDDEAKYWYVLCKYLFRFLWYLPNETVPSRIPLLTVQYLFTYVNIMLVTPGIRGVGAPESVSGDVAHGEGPQRADGLLRATQAAAAQVSPE